VVSVRNAECIVFRGMCVSNLFLTAAAQERDVSKRRRGRRALLAGLPSEHRADHPAGHEERAGVGCIECCYECS
jgi:hypothetical protein